MTEFGRYFRKTVGIVDAAKVFHSFRRGFKDAACSLKRRDRPNSDLGRCDCQTEVFEPLPVLFSF
jgi:hypothetical protein